MGAGAGGFGFGGNGGFGSGRGFDRDGGVVRLVAASAPMVASVVAGIPKMAVA